MLALQVKNKITVILKKKKKITVTCETDQTAQMASCYLIGAYLLKAARPPDSRPLATRLSLQRTFHWWDIRRILSERENAGSP